MQLRTPAAPSDDAEAAQAFSEIGASDARRGASLTSPRNLASNRRLSFSLVKITFFPRTDILLTASTCEAALHHGRAPGSCPRPGGMRMVSGNPLKSLSNSDLQQHQRLKFQHREKQALNSKLWQEFGGAFRSHFDFGNAAAPRR
ncbi:uncharacterized protein PAN0_008d3444 [Moesziomyces antarcticus]|uniref:Uncharacterized protein n=2 Tax=Pseudozyma antarctica TaxID=84753 RepID=A0A5C3FP58_PSEA2|nr:uncharacterized protein PAN0_008d3444 [Moesziomyces antarcticus]GAK65227.1 hypothetical protein PAN0_008d3444 [Moesziomyces antarcticus]SPO46228.1 uncharacterized protein PSANT_03914 [Moesziomyces antarcticus]